VVTPTANRTISFPNATGTVALVAGSSGQLLYNNAGVNAGVPSSVVGATGDITLALNGAASTPPLDVTGTWFTGGTSTTTKPQVLIEPAGTTSTAWSTSGTGLGVNAASGFVGRLLDLQTNGTSRAVVTGAGLMGIGTTAPSANIDIIGALSGAANNTITGASLRVQSTIAGGENFAIRHRDSTNGISGLNSCVQLIGQGTNALELYTAGGSPLVLGTNTVERARIDSSGRLLVGTSTTRSDLVGLSPRFQVEGSDQDGSTISAARNSNTEAGPALLLAKSRGTTAGAVTIVQTNDLLGGIYFMGADGTNVEIGAQITAAVDGTPGSDDLPSRLVFSTAADGSASPTERMRITSAGVLQVADAGNITVGTTTGTKIGTATTQKIGFYNATPVVQPAAVADATTAVDVITQLNDLLAKLRTLGIIAT
jgi:hypothetical protein